MLTLGNGGPGETIAFGSDGFLHHYSGCCVLNVNTVLERIDTVANTVVPIALSGFSYYDILSATLWILGNHLGADLNAWLIVIDTSGVATLQGTIDHSAVKGLAFVPSPATQGFFRPYGLGCAATSGSIPLLGGTGTPSAGFNVRLNLIPAPQNGAGILALGTETQSLSILSAACPVRIMPILPGDVPFTASAAGTSSVGATVPAGLPAELYSWIALVDGIGFVLSNTLRAHIQQTG